jgi:hypothetical protein
VVEIRAAECPECSHRFGRRLAALPPRIPEVAEGELKRVDAALMRQLQSMPYRRLLAWIGNDPGRAEQARRARRYKRGWVWHVLSKAA